MTIGDSRNAPVVITGGLGFIGSHLARTLAHRGAWVHIIDDASAQRDPPVDILLHQRIRVSRASVLDRSALRRLMNGDMVLHLASMVGVERVMKNPQLAREIAAVGSRNVLELCASRNISCCLFSTSEVYGPDREELLAESSVDLRLPSTDARLAYAAGKLDAEAMARELAAAIGLRVLIIRPFNVAGPGQAPESGMVIPRFCDRALRGLPIEVYGDGRQTRCFLHVADFVDMVLQLLDHPSAYGQAINIGSSEEISIESLAQRVIDLSGSASVVVKRPYEAVFGPGFRDFRRRCPDLKLLDAMLGKRAPRALNQIVADTLDAVRSTRRPELASSAG